MINTITLNSRPFILFLMVHPTQTLNLFAGIFNFLIVFRTFHGTETALVKALKRSPHTTLSLNMTLLQVAG